MKKLVCGIIVALGVIVCVLLFPETSTSSYFRFNVVASSQSAIDQKIKTSVSNSLLTALLPYVSKCESVEDCKNIAEELIYLAECVANNEIMKAGVQYKAKAFLTNNYFDNCTVENCAFDAGYYDAFVVVLGDGKGDLFNGVMYPPLSFKGASGDILYRSKIIETIQNWLKK